MTKIFSDIHVLELASVLAGPSVGQFFVELGAEVIKVENPKTGGDVTRSWTSQPSEDFNAPYFNAVNWGKKSVTLDATIQEQRSNIYALVKRADIVIVSYKPGDAKKLGLDYASLNKINTKIIYGEITGYGSEIQRVGYDAVIQAESGFMHINGEVDGLPTKMPVALIDIIAGHQLKEALLLGIIHKLKTGEGSYHSVSLMDAALSCLANQATNYLQLGIEPQRSGSKHPNIAPYGELITSKDQQHILLAIGSDKQFGQLLDILKIEPNENWSTNTKRIQHRNEIHEVLVESAKHFESNELLKQFLRFNIPAGKINKVSEGIQSFGKELLLSIGEKPIALQTFVSNSSIYKRSPHILPPPKLGEHTEEILNLLNRDKV